MGDGPGFRKMRRELGVTAFGINAIVLPPGYSTGAALPRRAGGDVLRPRRHGRVPFRRRHRRIWCMPAASSGSMRPPIVACATPARTTRSWSPRAARTATWAATGRPSTAIRAAALRARPDRGSPDGGPRRVTGARPAAARAAGRRRRLGRGARRPRRPRDGARDRPAGLGRPYQGPGSGWQRPGGAGCARRARHRASGGRRTQPRRGDRRLAGRPPPRAGERAGARRPRGQPRPLCALGSLAGGARGWRAVERGHVDGEPRAGAVGRPSARWIASTARTAPTATCVGPGTTLLRRRPGASYAVEQRALVARPDRARA